MRYCPNCRRINEGWPERCRYCAATWGVRICKRGHPNPANASFCGECGSADMTEPARGGRIANTLFQLPQKRGLLFLILKIAIPLWLFFTIANNLPLFLPLLVGIYILVSMLKFAFGQLPGWLGGPIMRFYRSRTKDIKNRASRRESRGD